MSFGLTFSNLARSPLAVVDTHFSEQEKSCGWKNQREFFNVVHFMPSSVPLDGKTFIIKMLMIEQPQKA